MIEPVYEAKNRTVTPNNPTIYMVGTDAHLRMCMKLSAPTPTYTHTQTHTHTHTYTGSLVALARPIVATACIVYVV